MRFCNAVQQDYLHSVLDPHSIKTIIPSLFIKAKPALAAEFGPKRRLPFGGNTFPSEMGDYVLTKACPSQKTTVLKIVFS
jgi:hypothetical protein